MTRRKQMLEQLDEDIRDHIERETQDNIDRGMSSQEARYAALRKFGNVARVKEQTYEVWAVTCLEQLLQDTRFGLRTLGRSPNLTIAAVMAIALGIGINVGIFSVLNGLAFRLLPVPRAQELLSVNQVLHFRSQGNRYIHNNYGYVSWSEYQDYRDHNHVFSGVAAYAPYLDATLAGSTARQLLGTAASCNYFVRIRILFEAAASTRHCPSRIDRDPASKGCNYCPMIEPEQATAMTIPPSQLL